MMHRQPYQVIKSEVDTLPHVHEHIVQFSLDVPERFCRQAIQYIEIVGYDKTRHYGHYKLI